MSNTYKHGERVPSDVLCARLNELADFVTKGPDVVRREFTMRVPAELDRDADLVISEAATRIEQTEQALAELLFNCEKSFDWQYDPAFAKAYDKAFSLVGATKEPQ